MASIIFALLLATNLYLENGVDAVRMSPNNVRMVGGDSVYIEEFPYQVSLLHFGAHICGGVILNRYFVLTAAQCFDYVYDTHEIQVRAGSSSAYYSGLIVDIDYYILHPDFNFESLYHDVAIIRLAYPLHYDNDIQPVLLPKQGLVLEEGVSANVTGWERFEIAGHIAGDLRNLEVEITDTMDCALVYLDKLDITEDKFICANSRSKYKSSCEGDEGAALLVDGLVVGLFSWVEECGNPEFPAIYTNLAEYSDWIYKVIDFEMF